MSEHSPNSVDPRVNPARQRTSMASYRTQLALARTTLAWVRTGLTMASFGFGMVAFFRSMLEQSRSSKAVRLHRGAIRTGRAMLILGIVGVVPAGVPHWLTLRRLRRRESPGLSQWPQSVILAMLTAVVALVGLLKIFAR
jgi:putative membrane protein